MILSNYPSNTTFCEGKDSDQKITAIANKHSNSNSDSSLVLLNTLTAAQLRDQKLTVQAELDRLDRQGPCPSCLYTGVATCAGLAAYFVHLAYDTSLPNAARQNSQRARHAQLVLLAKQRPYFLGIAAAWVGAGVYRWQLG
jgi:hypothetical protein